MFVIYVCLLLFAQYFGFVGFLEENLVYGLFLTSAELVSTSSSLPTAICGILRVKCLAEISAIRLSLSTVVNHVLIFLSCIFIYLAFFVDTCFQSHFVIGNVTMNISI